METDLIQKQKTTFEEMIRTTKNLISESKQGLHDLKVSSNKDERFVCVFEETFLTVGFSGIEYYISGKHKPDTWVKDVACSISQKITNGNKIHPIAMELSEFYNKRITFDSKTLLQIEERYESFKTLYPETNLETSINNFLNPKN